MDPIYSTSLHNHFFRSLESAIKAVEDAGYIYQGDMADFRNGQDPNRRMTFIRPADQFGFFPASTAFIGFSLIA